MDRLPPLPVPPSPPPRAPFPIIAVIAPAVGAVAISLITGSMVVLVFAALSPLIAIATALDARRSARRHRRDEAARFDRDCAAWSARVPELHALERAQADREHPRVGELAAAALAPAHDAPLRVGIAPSPSALALDQAGLAVESAVGERLQALASRASTHPGLPVLVPPGPVRVIGQGSVADALSRLVSLHPGCVIDRPGRPGSMEEVPSSVELVVESPTRAVLRTPDGRHRMIRPEGASRREVELARARRVSGAAEVPSAVRWAALARSAASASRALDPGTVGSCADGPAALDLLGDSPHVLVGGTTGSGKSEFLRTLALSWAAGAPPRERSILLVDFKGGSAFAELDALPHVVGVITDLDGAGAERALRSLRAEIRRRELLLLEHGARDVREAPPGSVARLLVLVDEYAALVETFPELQPLMADLSARGRSLGVHLVLCTQRPSGVVRDAVAANCGTRVAFRMASAADAAGLLPGAPPPADAPAGRAVIASTGRSSTVQVATIEAADVAAVVERWRAAEPAVRPWLPPLPSRVSAAEVASLGDPAPPADSVSEGSAFAPTDARSPAPAPLTIPFGVLDDPDHQRRVRAVWRPRRDGALLVVGSEGSGARSALATLGAAAHEDGAVVAVLPAALPDALGTIDELRCELDESGSTPADPLAPHPMRRPTVLVVPDIDTLIAEAGEGALDLLDALDSLVRRLRRGGGALVASSSSVLRARSGVVSRFDSVLLLRTASLDDHRAAGGAPADHDADAPPGRGRWQGRSVQVADPPRPLPAERTPRVDWWAPQTARSVAVVSARPRRLARALSLAGWAVSLDPAAPTPAGVSTGQAALDPAGGPPHAIVADAEAWQSSWATLARVRREGAIVIADVSAADARLVLGARTVVPLRGSALEEVIVVEDGEPPRRVRWSALAAGAEAPARRSG